MAEASAWLARMHADDRTLADEEKFRQWLEDHPDHRRAFAHISTTWELAGGVALEPTAESARRRRVNRRVVLGGGAAMALAAPAAFWWQTAAAATYKTQVGEQRRVALPDGSSVFLDTDTHLRFASRPHRRVAELLGGRAHFDVSTDVERPFLVRAGDQQIVAPRSSFEVTCRSGKVGVIAMRGSLTVRPRNASEGLPRLVAPGERVVVDSGRATQDSPDMRRITAWREGRAVFVDQPLLEAIAEMNRYSRRPIVVQNARLGAMRISGVYDTGNAEAFAESVSALLPAQVAFTPDKIIIDSLAREKSNRAG